jgi:F0F1-type ATP synthase membrane subunit c/vacuolar-type H+-ATPase subunit K
MDPETVKALTHTLLDISHNLRYVGAGAAIAALGGVGTGIGIVFGAFNMSFARRDRHGDWIDISTSGNRFRGESAAG